MRFNPIVVIVPVVALLIGVIGIRWFLPFVREATIEAPGVKIAVKTKDAQIGVTPSALSTPPISPPSIPKEEPDNKGQIITHLIVHNGGYGEGRIEYFEEQIGQFECKVSLQGLKPKGIYVLTINGKIGHPGNDKLMKEYNRNNRGEGYYDSSYIKADGNGCIQEQLKVKLPPSFYEVKFFVKDVTNNWRVILKNDNVQFTVQEMPEQTEKLHIEITDPHNGQNVTHIYTVKGKVSHHELKFYVLVHPLSTRAWWVQSFPDVQDDGTWKSGCCFGTDVLGIGDSYEIWAIATKEKLYVGQQIDVDEVPEITVGSNVVRVTRPK
ncbi:MAG: hypothetical protein AB1414_07835 [bacterium]